MDLIIFLQLNVEYKRNFKNLMSDIEIPGMKLNIARYLI